MPVRSYPYVSFHFPNKFEFFLVLLDSSHSGVPSRCFRSSAAASTQTHAQGFTLILYNEQETVRCILCQCALLLSPVV